MRISNICAFFCFILFSGCVITVAQPATYYPYATLFGNRAGGNSTLADELARVSAPLPEAVPLPCQWYFFAGAPAEGLVTAEAAGKGTAVALPHRINMPDHPLWYKATLRTTGPCILHIEGDDGVQLFVNGAKVQRLQGNFFRVDAYGDLKLTVRVLNNAMAGGLRAAAQLSLRAYDAYRQRKERYLRLTALAEKAMLMREVKQEHVNLVMAALCNTSEVTLEQAEAVFENYPMLTGPYIHDGGDGHVTISCETDGNAPMELYTGASKDKLRLADVKAAPYARFELRDVKGRYFYQLRSGKTRSDIFTFNPATPAAPFSFNVWADSQSGWQAFAANVMEISKQNDAFGVGVGDLVADGYDTEHWRKFLGILSWSAAERPYYLVAGNHDYDGYYEDLKPANYLKYASHQAQPYFSWTWGNAAFIALDPNANFPVGIPAGSDQHKWFHRQIASDEWKRATWRFVFLHQPPYSQGWAGYHGDKCIRDLLDPVIEQAGIDVVVSGHTHDYERLVKQYGRQRTTMLIVGGGGGTLEPPESSAAPKMDVVMKTHHFGRFTIDGNAITFRALDSKGSVIDSLNFQK